MTSTCCTVASGRRWRTTVSTACAARTCPPPTEVLRIRIRRAMNAFPLLADYQSIRSRSSVLDRWGSLLPVQAMHQVVAVSEHGRRPSRVNEHRHVIAAEAAGAGVGDQAGHRLGRVDRVEQDAFAVGQKLHRLPPFGGDLAVPGPDEVLADFDVA